MAELTNAIQRFFVERTRLGIPVIFHEECLHGHAAREGTSFPQPIGLGATFDPDLVERLYTMTAAEARARGAHQALAPDLDVARDPRWGRTEETFGEDPYLIGRMGVAAVRGFQGDARFTDKTTHHRDGEALRGARPARVGDELRARSTCRCGCSATCSCPPFKSAIQEGGALSVMPSYNEIDGVPSHANRWLLGDVLRGEWGFKGFVVSDYFAIRELNERPEFFGHHVARDGKEAAALAVLSGVDIELPDPDCYPHLVELVREGTIPESVIDDRIRPMLRAKFQLGLFDDPYVDPAEAERIVREPSHRRLALEAARKTITLLKNEAARAPNRPGRGPHDCRDRAERRSGHAGRVQRHAAPGEHRAAGDPGTGACGCAGPLPRGMQDHDWRVVASG